MKAQRQILKIPEQSFRCFRRAEPSFGYFRHYHPELELVLIEEGRGLLMIGDKVLNWAPGDLFLLGPQLAHAWQSLASEGAAWHSAVVLQLPSESISRLLPVEAASSLLERAPRGMRFEAPKAALLCRTLTAPTPFPDRLLAKLLQQLSSAPAEILLEQEHPELRREVALRLEKLLKWTHQRLDRPLSSAEAAAFLEISLPSFCRFFRSAMGLSYLDYIDEIRLATSCEALRQPQASLESIIAAQGWRSAPWFHRRFKTKMGCTPMAWRKRQEGK